MTSIDMDIKCIILMLHFVYSLEDIHKHRFNQENYFNGTKRYTLAKRQLLTYNENGRFSFMKTFTKNDDRIQKFRPNSMQDDVKMVGIFLAAHKYFELDVRYKVKSSINGPQFYKNFPKPSLKQMNSAVHRACEKGAIPCVREIANTARVSPLMSWFSPNKTKGDTKQDLFYPFKSKLQLFQYRTTASYYMCWYTDNQAEVLGLPGTEPCFENLQHVQGAGSIDDYRDKYASSLYRRKKTVAPFMCAYLWFCPDPCYGRSTKGNVENRRAGRNDKLNPCSGMERDKSCFWIIGGNTNFNDLIINRINYTCNCESDQDGFYWNPKYRLCVDKDECYDKTDDCPVDRVCRNTKGSFKCTCRRGQYLDAATNSCKRHATMKLSSQQGLKQQNTPSSDTEDTEGFSSRFWFYVDTVLGLGTSDGSKLNVSFCQIIMLVVYTQLCTS